MNQPYHIGDEVQIMKDIAAPENVEIEIRADGKVVWVHVNGVTALRVGQVGKLVVNDHRDSERVARDEIDQIQRDVIQHEANERGELHRKRFAATDRELSFDEAEAAGFDGTGTDGDPRFPYHASDLNN